MQLRKYVQKVRERDTRPSGEQTPELLRRALHLRSERAERGRARLGRGKGA